MVLGPRVRELRTERGLSQERLAHQAGLSWGAIQRLESGQVTDPHYSTLSGIAQALGMSVAELAGEEPAVPKASASPNVGQISEVSDIEELRQMARELKAEWNRIGVELHDRAVAGALPNEEYRQMDRRMKDIERDILAARLRAQALRDKLDEYAAEGVFELVGAAG
jgi:transcriptional regulator with XRE-family HTH domain